MILWTFETTNDFMRRIDGIGDNEKKKKMFRTFFGIIILIKWIFMQIHIIYRP